MKKTLIILALALAMVAVASVAYAVNPADPDAALHGGYSTATNACQQCHDVHGAETYVDAPLWRWANAAAGCAYCHGDGTGAGGATTVDVYGDVATAEAVHTIGAAVIPDATDNSQITDAAVAALDCFDCHNGGVHGTGGGYYVLTTDATANAFCGRCHDLNLTNGVVDGTSHVLAAADNTHAWVGSPNCISCHDDEGELVPVDFPHATPNYVFAGGDSDVATLDAVCLACHVDDIGTPTAGVGVTY